MKKAKSRFDFYINDVFCRTYELHTASPQIQICFLISDDKSHANLLEFPDYSIHKLIFRRCKRKTTAGKIEIWYNCNTPQKPAAQEKLLTCKRSKTVKQRR